MTVETKVQHAFAFFERSATPLVLQNDEAPGLILKAPITTAADDSHKYFFNCFTEKIRLDNSSE